MPKAPIYLDLSARPSSSTSFTLTVSPDLTPTLEARPQWIQQPPSTNPHGFSADAPLDYIFDSSTDEPIHFVAADTPSHPHEFRVVCGSPRARSEQRHPSGEGPLHRWSEAYVGDARTPR